VQTGLAGQPPGYSRRLEGPHP